MNSFKFTIRYVEYTFHWKFYDENKCSVSYKVEYDFNNETEIFCEGHVKWDGCSNWHFPEFEKCMFHACTQKELTLLAEIPMKCWAHASAVLPDFQGEIGD